MWLHYTRLQFLGLFSGFEKEKVSFYPKVHIFSLVLFSPTGFLNPTLKYLFLLFMYLEYIKFPRLENFIILIVHKYMNIEFFGHFERITRINSNSFNFYAFTLILGEINELSVVK